MNEYTRVATAENHLTNGKTNTFHEKLELSARVKYLPFSHNIA
jgi:hypothetical protein